MATIVICPGCNGKLKLPESSHAHKVKCPHCGALLDHTGHRARRLGVALSGGGFRAAFFHIGMLAQMARLGMLRHVEVVSTVSGGSIVGALYYLLLKGLLEEKADAAIVDQDYRDLVLRLEEVFFNATQQNLRVRTLLNPFTLIKTCLPDFSRTDQLGNLLDEYFFRPVVDRARSTPIRMRELRIQPKGGPGDFHPYRHNEGRSAKVPVLLINATTLNTGHNWRFEASRMGEPQLHTALFLEIDKQFRLRRPGSYEELTPRHRDMELGMAVAASCCVPGLFPPLALTGLYDRHIRVQLVDGCVHDNQGIDGLFDRECTDFVISDGSEQMGDEIDPAVQLLPIFLRSTDILGNQLREEALLRLMETGDRRVALVHLRKGLPAEAIAWLDPNGRPAASVLEERLTKESFGVPKETQDDLSHMRTDLDSFTEVEAYSLMLNAYLLSGTELQKVGGSLCGEPVSPESCTWKFLKIEQWLRHSTPRYRRRLKVARYRHFKLFRLKWPVTLALLLVVMVLGAWMARYLLPWAAIGRLLAMPIQLGMLLGLAVALGAVVLPQVVDVARWPWQWPWWLRTPGQIVGRFLVLSTLALVISIVSALQLYLIDPLYQRSGRLGRLGQPPKGGP